MPINHLRTALLQQAFKLAVKPCCCVQLQCHVRCHDGCIRRPSCQHALHYGQRARWRLGLLACWCWLLGHNRRVLRLPALYILHRHTQRGHLPVGGAVLPAPMASRWLLLLHRGLMPASLPLQPWRQHGRGKRARQELLPSLVRPCVLRQYQRGRARTTAQRFPCAPPVL